MNSIKIGGGFEVDIDSIRDRYNYSSGLINSSGGYDELKNALLNASKNRATVIHKLPIGTKIIPILDALKQMQCRSYVYLAPASTLNEPVKGYDIPNQIKTNTMKKAQKVIALENVLLTEDERQKVADELQLDKDAISRANSLSRDLRNYSFEEKKRIVKFLIHAIDADYEEEKKALADKITHYENVLLDKNSKQSAENTFLK